MSSKHSTIVLKASSSEALGKIENEDKEMKSTSSLLLLAILENSEG